MQLHWNLQWYLTTLFSKHMDCTILIFLQHKHKGTLLILWRTDRPWMGWCTRRLLQKNIYSIKCQKCSSHQGFGEISFCCLKIHWNVYLFYMHTNKYRLYLKTQDTHKYINIWTNGCANHSNCTQTIICWISNAKHDIIPYFLPALPWLCSFRNSLWSGFHVVLVSALGCWTYNISLELNIWYRTWLQPCKTHSDMWITCSEIIWKLW